MALRSGLRAERATLLVTSALREWSRDVFRRIGASMTGSAKEKWAAFNWEAAARIGTDIETQMLRVEPDAVEFNMKGASYCDFRYRTKSS